MSINDNSFARLGIIGLGYVGLPVAVAMAKAGHDVVGFDIKESRLDELRRCEDLSGSVSAETLHEASLTLTGDPQDLRNCEIFIIAVPTPVDAAKRPDLTPFLKAAETVGSVMRKDSIVVFESTVFPGATEELAVPVLEQSSGMALGSGFEVGYSPERINPGDTERDFADIVKIVAASSLPATDRLCQIYGSVVKAGLHRAPSIRVAEASKVIENTQRDLNIALMNELAMLFHAMGIDTRDVLEGSATKWNFLPFQPGLVGGHCIGVDPYYLTHKANELGMTPQVILAGRGTNEIIPAFVAGKVIQSCVRLGRPMPPKITVLGLTYKANVPDTRNSKVIDLVRELMSFGAQVRIFDPLADADAVKADHGLLLSDLQKPFISDAVILAVPHATFFEGQDGWQTVRRFLDEGRCLVADIPALLPRNNVPDNVELWRL